MNLLVRWLLNTVALLLVAWLVPGLGLHSFATALAAAAVLGLLNALVRPLLFFLTLPITILSLGLFLIVLNAFMLELTSWLIPGFHIASFLSAVVGAVVLSLISLITDRIGRPKTTR